MSLPPRECCLSPAACCLPWRGREGALGFRMASSPWCPPAITGKGGPSLTVRLLGILLRALFCWLWVGAFFFFFNGSTWEIFYKVLPFCSRALLNPTRNQQNVCGRLSVTAHWVLFWRLSLVGLVNIGKRIMKCSHLNLSRVNSKRANHKRSYTVWFHLLLFPNWHFREEEWIRGCQGLREFGDLGRSVGMPVKGELKLYLCGEWHSPLSWLQGWSHVSTCVNKQRWATHTLTQPQCQCPGFDVLLELWKVELPGKTEWKVPRTSLHCVLQLLLNL